MMVNSEHLILSLQPAIYVTSSCSYFLFPVFLNTITYIAVVAKKKFSCWFLWSFRIEHPICNTFPVRPALISES